MRSLLWKLLGINLLVIAFVMLIVWLAIDYLAADYFMTLMTKYNISPVDSNRMFLSAVHRYLLWASLGALLLAAGFSFLMMSKVLGPLRQITRITREIAAGDYTGRVPFASRDEVGQLAASFNSMAESLRRLEGLRKTMMIDVAHELRTPLTNIRGYLEALNDGVVAPRRETFALLLEETLRLARLVEDILRLARADAARTDLHKLPVQIEDLIRQALDAFETRFQSKEIRVETNLAPGVGPLPADPDKLSQVLANLLENACQYTPAGGRVRIYTERLREGIRVIFANTGGELSEKDLPFIFERFFRGEKSRSREHGGAGIGLAIVKELIKAHGGEVGAEIEGPETRVWFLLPL